MSKNGNILSFFKPVPSSQASQPTASHSQTSLTPITANTRARNNTSSFASSPRIPSSPPVAQPNLDVPRPAISRDTVIKGSDEEDSDDSDSLPDLFLPSKRPAAGVAGLGPAPPPRPEPDTCVTPRAKRTAREWPDSPLSVRTKHRFDMNALLRGAEKDDITEASAQSLSALMQQEEDVARPPNVEFDEDVEDATVGLKEHIMESAAMDDGDDEVAGKRRVVRALERADVTNAPKRFYFFEQEAPQVSVLERPFPNRAAKGTWAILKDGKERQAHFISGLPFDIQARFQDLPDEIFFWLLDEACYECSDELRSEYIKLLSISSGQTSQLVDSNRLQQLFSNLGATEDIRNLSSPLSLRDETSNPYPNRNWACLRDILNLVARMSSHLSSEALSTAMQILLRMGVDDVAVNSFALTQFWRSAVESVARNVPGGKWNSFCEDVATSLYNSSEKAAMRWRPISMIGEIATGSARAWELQRRLAAVFFFGDLQRATQRPERTVTIRAIIDRLEHDEFVLDAQTNYRELQALMMMLNATLDDASRESLQTSEARTSFDEEVDELARKIKNMLSRVTALNKGVHVSRIEAKNAMELIHDKLLWAIRTKEREKIKIFDDASPKADPSVPKQQDFMQNFLARKGKAAKG